MAHLALALLGGFQVALDGQPVTGFKSNKVRALLAYLAVEADRPHRRETLAGLLWPERTDRDALNNLRYSLANLRKTLNDRSSATPFLLIDHDTVQFNLDGDVSLDVNLLLARIAAVRSPHAAAIDLLPATIADLQSALALYRGSLLAGFSAGDATSFEEWLLLRREQIEQQVTWTLACLTATHEARGDFPQAQTCARRHVALEPWNEDAHRALMRALALDRQRSAALHQFQVCRRILADELGVEPAGETVALNEAIRVGHWVGKEPGKAVDGAGLHRPASPVYGSRFAQQSISPAVPVVARDEQLTRLNIFLAQALAGTGRVVFVAGEAGSGKSALLAEFTRRAMQTYVDLLVASGACDAATGIGDPYLPFREILQLLTGDIEPKRAGTGLTPVHARRLWAAIPDAVHALVAQGPNLIDTFVPGAGLELRAQAFLRQSNRGAWHARLAQLLRSTAGDGQGARDALQLTDIFEQVTHVLQAIARQHPLVLVLDDLQWADAGSISLLFHLGRRISTSRILVVAAYRPDGFAAPSERERHPLDVVINELLRISGQEPIDLDACEGRPFVEELLDIEPNRLGAAFREQLLHHTEGHPLFTVELLHSMEERGDLVRDAQGRWTEGPALHWHRLPTRVEAAIAERIGQLPERCRSLLAIASVEGEEFTAEVVAPALNVTEASVIQCLSSDLGERHRLVTAVSLRRLGARKISRYRFRHNLFQRYLYDHLDGVRRAHLHEAVGSALERLYGETPDELHVLAPRLAWHFEQAGLADRAALHHLQAGNRSTKLAAHQDAIDHLSRGLALLEALTDSPERVRLRMDLQLALVSPISLARGFWAPERIQTLERAYEISQHPEFDESAQRWAVSAAVAYFAAWSADPRRSLRISKQLLQMAERNQDLQQLHWAHSLLGFAHLMHADLILAQEHLDQAIIHNQKSDHPWHDVIVGLDMGIMSLAWQSFALWQLGYPERAARRLQEALSAAQDSSSSIVLAFARSIASMVLFLCARDTTAAWQHVQALRQSNAVSMMFGAWADSLAGSDAPAGMLDEKALQGVRQGIATFEKQGSGLGRAAQLLLLAQAYARVGQPKAGLDLVEDVLQWMESTGVYAFAAEARRLQGKLLLMDQPFGEGSARAAETCFRAAIAVARQQGARWWEMRATVSLCRLLQEQSAAHNGRRAEARQMLAEIYGWFSEGFDTLDLREARELLEQLKTP